jgi:hypothetical protein
LPIYWALSLPRRALAAIKGQYITFSAFNRAIHARGADVLCRPQEFPGLIRWPLYFLASPAPMKRSDVDGCGLDPDQLLQMGVIRQMRADGWYAFETLNFAGLENPVKVRQLFWSTWNPVRKWTNTLAWRRAALGRVEP